MQLGCVQLCTVAERCRCANRCHLLPLAANQASWSPRGGGCTATPCDAIRICAVVCSKSARAGSDGKEDAQNTGCALDAALNQVQTQFRRSSDAATRERPSG